MVMLAILGICILNNRPGDAPGSIWTTSPAASPGKLTATLVDKIKSGTDLRTLVAAGKNDQDVISELYLAALSRPPSQAELDVSTKHIAAAGERIKGLEDVCWALLNANEFLFQH